MTPLSDFRTHNAAIRKARAAYWRLPVLTRKETKKP